METLKKKQNKIFIFKQLTKKLIKSLFRKEETDTIESGKYQTVNNDLIFALSKNSGCWSWRIKK